MATLSLKQLQEENEADEKKEAESANDTEEVKAEADALEEHIEGEADEVKDAGESEDEAADEEADDTDDGEKGEVEEWMKTGDDDEEKPEIDNNVAKNIRLRATAKAERKSEGEITRLQAENDALRSAQVPAPQGLSMPNRDDYLDQDDPDTAYLVALSEYNSKKHIAEITASQQVSDQKRQQDEQKRVIETNVDKHYEAAVTLSEGSNITAESYRSADLAVREMVEGLYPDAGDALVDAFISKVGAGSERVFFNLGINKARLAQFKETLVNDPTGLDAAIFLGGLNKELNKNVKRKSSAPPPAKHAKGDAGQQVSSKSRAMKKTYEVAHQKGDSQAAYNAKKNARAAGVDVSSW